ncbi:hypothetical protein GCM10027435_12210 [Haloparvum alkalitolerans]
MLRGASAQRGPAGRAGWGFLGGAVSSSSHRNGRSSVVARAGWGFLGGAVPSDRLYSSFNNIVQRAGWGFLDVTVQLRRISNRNENYPKATTESWIKNVRV